MPLLVVVDHVCVCLFRKLVMKLPVAVLPLFVVRTKNRSHPLVLAVSMLTRGRVVMAARGVWLVGITAASIWYGCHLWCHTPSTLLLPREGPHL